MSFGEGTDTTDTTDTAATGSALPDGKIIIGDRVYTPDALNTKVTSQDAHIATLEAEAQVSADRTEKLINRIEAMEKKIGDSEDIKDLVDKLPATAPTGNEPKALSTEELIAATKDALLQEQVNHTQESNLNAMVAAAKDAYGKEFGDKVDAIGEGHGMDGDAVLTMARNQPKLFAKLFLPEGADIKVIPNTMNSQGGDTGLKPAIADKPRVLSKLTRGKERLDEINRRFAVAMGDAS